MTQETFDSEFQMAYTNANDHQEAYNYYPGNNYGHYVSDRKRFRQATAQVKLFREPDVLAVNINGSAGTDESNFWSSSPRSDSPSPNAYVQSTLGGPYQTYKPISYSPVEHHLITYRNGYSQLTMSDMGTNHNVPFVRVVKRRSTANKKERRRTQSINNAYADLRDCIPNVPADTKLSKVRNLEKPSQNSPYKFRRSINNAYADLRDRIPNLPADTKLSKIKTLRLATSYISYLTRALESDDTAGGFKAELAILTRKSSNNPLQASDDQQTPPGNEISEDMNNQRKAKGRTGWPQHVWALELKQEQTI